MDGERRQTRKQIAALMAALRADKCRLLVNGRWLECRRIRQPKKGGKGTRIRYVLH